MRSNLAKMDFLKLSFLIIHSSWKFMRKGLKTVMNSFSSSPYIFVMLRISPRVSPF
jgi:hypothetical protein